MAQASTNTAQADPRQRKLAGELRLLAAEPAFELRRAELIDLAHDLEQNTRLDRWADVDLVQAYVRPESLAQPPPAPRAPLRSQLRVALAAKAGARALVRVIRDEMRQRPVREGALEASLGVLVFVPLLITWFGLREAVRAYGELSQENPKEATRPFLQLWQTGFGGHLSSTGRFENVALMAVVLISLLVVLSLWHARARSRADRVEAKLNEEQEYALGRLASLLTRIQLALVPHRAASPQQFTAGLSKAATRMESLASRADRSHSSLVSSAKALEDATTSLESAALALTGELPKLGTAADRIEAAVRGGQAATAQAGAENQAAAGRIADRIKSAGDTVEASLKALAAAQQTLATKSETVAQATERASKALVDSAGRTNDAVDGMREATERWDAAAAHWQDAAARLETGLRGITVPPAGAGSGAVAGPDAGYAVTTVPAPHPEPESAGAPTLAGGRAYGAGFEYDTPTERLSVNGANGGPNRGANGSSGGGAGAGPDAPTTPGIPGQGPARPQYPPQDGAGS
ncbi:hypothetical protein [Streptomyces sp. NPDC059209]|uniref:hypothetical protein n=1 Tax=Streptomyces sp. NPDC059209 TaxID=3346769 RepID=UPI0036A0CF18